MTRLPTLVLGHKRLVVLFWLTVTAAGLAYAAAEAALGTGGPYGAVRVAGG